MISFLIMTVFLFTVLCFWVLIESRKAPKMLFLSIPLMLGLIGFSYETYQTLLGVPKPISYLLAKKKPFLYIAHYVSEPTNIYIWVLEKGDIPQSYVVGYTEELHKALQDVEQKNGQGETILLEPTDDDFGENSEHGEGGDSKTLTGRGFTKGGGMEFYSWDYESDPRFNKR